MLLQKSTSYSFHTDLDGSVKVDYNRSQTRVKTQMSTTKKQTKKQQDENLDLFNRGKDAIAKLRENNFEFIEVLVAEATFYEIGFNERSKKPVQNIEFVHNGEDFRLAVSNSTILAEVIDAVEDFSSGNEEAKMSLPVSSRDPKLMKENEGTFWVY